MDVKAQWEVVCQLQTAADFADFLAGIDVWIRRPHVVNKRVVGASILQERAVPKDGGSDRPVTGDHLSSRQLLRELIPRGGGPSVKELVTIGRITTAASIKILDTTVLFHSTRTQTKTMARASSRRWRHQDRSQFQEGDI